MSSDQRQRLHGLFPERAFDEIVLLVVRHPRHAKVFADIGAQIVSPESNIWGLPVDVPREHWDRFVGVVLRVADEIAVEGSKGGVSRRDPLPVREVETVLKLRFEGEGMSWLAIETLLKGKFSGRKIDYVRIALKHGDLGWDRGEIIFGRP